LTRVSPTLLALLVVASGAVTAGCTGGESNIPQNALVSAASAIDADAMARSVRVATTAACAQTYGLAVDATKLKASYLSYETGQGVPRAQLAAIEDSYDAAYQAAAGRCSGKDGADLKAHLLRYQAGYFTPRTPPSEPPFNVKTVWDMQD
jgi:hypothetical protein